MDKLRTALIGCGGNGRGHLRRLAGNGEVEILGLADPDAGGLAAAKEIAPDAATFSDYRKLLDVVELDAVAISTPHTQHTEQVLAALDAGLHVLIEKPLCCSVDDTKKIAAAAESAGRHVVVSFQRRGTGLWRTIRRLVRDASFGRAWFISSFISQGWLWLTDGKWRQDPALAGGGQLNDTGAHLIDMIFWVMPGRVAEVSAFIENRTSKVDIDSAITFRFDDGAVGTLSVVGSGPRPAFWEDVTITGDAGRGLFLRRDKLTLVEEDVVSEVTKLPSDRDPDSHFVDVIRGRAENMCPPADFLPNIAFTAACWQSAEQGGAAVKVEY